MSRVDEIEKALDRIIEQSNGFVRGDLTSWSEPQSLRIDDILWLINKIRMCEKSLENISHEFTISRAYYIAQEALKELSEVDE